MYVRKGQISPIVGDIRNLRVKTAKGRVGIILLSHNGTKCWVVVNAIDNGMKSYDIH